MKRSLEVPWGMKLRYNGMGIGIQERQEVKWVCFTNLFRARRFHVYA